MMELRSGRFTNCQNSVLPNELIHKVLMQLEIKQLLNCRFVSKVFKCTATAICRRRHVKLDLNWDVHSTRNLQILYLNFSKRYLNDLPFSACKLFSRKEKARRSGKCFDSLTPAQIQQFLAVFGPHFTQLHIGGNNYPVIFKILKGMPNLRVLKCEISEGSECVPTSQLIPTEELKMTLPTLSHLNHLQVEVMWLGQVEFLELLIRNMVKSQLDSIRIVMKARHGSADYSERVASHVAHIPSVFLDLVFIGPRQMEPFSTFMAHHVPVREFAFTIPDPGGGLPEFFLPLQLFLASNSETLEKLVVEDREWGPENPCSTRLTIPSLRALKFFKFHCDVGLVHPPLVLLSPFTPNQFPSLVKVKVVYLNGFFGVFNSSEFPTVTSLVIKDYNEENTNPMRTEWDRIFPNLRRLEVRGVSSGALEYICRHMTQLVHLSLRVNTVGCHDENQWSRGNASSILSGYPPLVLPEDEEVLPRRNTVTLVAMTALRTLILDFRDCTEFPDSDIHLSLLQIQPLEYLSLRDMCEESKVELRRYHHRFEII